MTKQPELSDVELKALIKTKKMFGRTWKQDLRNCWLNAHYPLLSDISPILQGLRNSAKFGPLGLVNVKI